MKQFTEDYIEQNFPIDDTLYCDNCGNGVYIMDEFTRLPELMEEMGKQEFIEWFTNYKIEIDSCGTCYHTLYMPYSHQTEMDLAKEFILNLIQTEDLA